MDTVLSCGTEDITGQVKGATTDHPGGQSSLEVGNVVYMVGLEGSPLL